MYLILRIKTLLFIPEPIYRDIVWIVPTQNLPLIILLNSNYSEISLSLTFHTEEHVFHLCTSFVSIIFK